MRLIDADRYKEELESLIEICDFEGENDVKEGIQSAIHTLDSEDFTPTVDAEPIIRCEECKYFNYGNGCILQSTDYDWEEQMYADDFCSRGVKR